MTFQLYKNTAKGTWYFARRVPLAYAPYDPRKIVRQTTAVRIKNDPHGVQPGLSLNA